MSSYIDVITDVTEMSGVQLALYEISDEEEAAITNLYNVNDNMINYWYGESGDVFGKLAGKIEAAIEANLRFSSNAAEAATMLINNAKLADEDSAEAVDVESGSGSGH